MGVPLWQFMYVAAESSRRGRQTPCGAGPAGGREERKGGLGREGCASRRRDPRETEPRCTFLKDGAWHESLGGRSPSTETKRHSYHIHDSICHTIVPNPRFIRSALIPSQSILPNIIQSPIQTLYLQEPSLLPPPLSIHPPARTDPSKPHDSHRPPNAHT
jgi:hypothetical protein